MSAVVSDSSPIRYLVECDAMEVLLHLFGDVLIPPSVYYELQNKNAPTNVRKWMQSPPDWLKVRRPGTLDLTLKIDRGEIEAIALAKEVNANALLMDDRRGRIVARQLGLRIAGTVGILEQAHLRGLVDFRAAVERLRNSNARLDDELIQAALDRLNTQ